MIIWPLDADFVRNHALRVYAAREVNDLLQGNVEDAGHNFFRFMMNTTFGLFGLLDPATDMGLEERETGFGETLHVWGAAEGAYVELPLFGPSTERDAVGQFVDVLTNPIGFLGDNGTEAAAASAFPSVLDSRYEFSDSVDAILYESADSYAQLRLFYHTATAVIAPPRT